MLAGMAVGSKLAGMYAFFVPALLIPPLVATLPFRDKGLPGVPGSPVKLFLLSVGVLSPVRTELLARSFSGYFSPEHCWLLKLEISRRLRHETYFVISRGTS
jgi:hypothetical protein